MPATPTISSALSALRAPSPASSINWNALTMKPPATPSAASPTFGFGSTPALPSISTGVKTSTPMTSGPTYNFANATTPAVPSIGNLQSNDTALRPGQFGAGPFATINADGSSTPSAYSKMPALPSLSPSASTYTPPANVKTNSGVTVNPATGGVVNDTAAVTPAVPSFDAANTGNASSATSYSASAGGAPGTYGGYGTGSSPSDLFSSYLSTLKPSEAESDAIKKLTDLNTAAATAYTNTENQPIALPFITGQQAALQRSQTLLATPLQQQIALLQAQRQIANEGYSKILDFTKPVATSYGGTLSRFNPATGKYETVVNPFGTASGGGGNTTDVIGQAIAEGRLSADQVTRYGIPFIAATLQSDPGYNFITQKASVGADTASLKTQQEYADSTSRAFNTANANLAQLKNFMVQSGVNSGSVPIANTIANRVKAGLTDPGTIAAFQAALAGLRAEYAQVLSRGGEVTDSQRNAAATLIPDNISPDQLQQVADRLNTEGNNAIKEANDKVKEIQGRIGKAGSSASSSSSSSSSSTNANDPLGIL